MSQIHCKSIVIVLDIICKTNLLISNLLKRFLKFVIIQKIRYVVDQVYVQDKIQNKHIQ